MCPKGNVPLTQSCTVRAAVYPFHSSAYDWLVLTESCCDLLQRASPHSILPPAPHASYCPCMDPTGFVCVWPPPAASYWCIRPPHAAKNSLNLYFSFTSHSLPLHPGQTDNTEDSRKYDENLFTYCEVLSTCNCKLPSNWNILSKTVILMNCMGQRICFNF